MDHSDQPALKVPPKQGQEEEKDHFNQSALETFSQWSNYLLVTTVAAVGWISSGHVKFHPQFLQSLSLWCLGASVIFGIFTLALVPLISEEAQKNDRSIYSVAARFYIFGIKCHAYLTQACRPQHVLFIAGIIVYCWGVTSFPWLAGVVGVAAFSYAFFSRRPETWRKRKSRGNDDSNCHANGGTQQ
jgi:hypothetical protein